MPKTIAAGATQARGVEQINVIQGVSAAGCLFQAIHPPTEAVLIHHDVLTCGPLEGFQNAAQWLALRESYWKSVIPEDTPRFSGLQRDLLTNAHALSQASSIVIWVGTGSAEQLFLAWFAEVLASIGSSAAVYAVQFAKFGDRQVDAWSLGLMNPDQMRAHPECWRCAAATDPAAFVEFLAGPAAELPLLRPGLAILLDRYPHYVHGVGRWDLELLKQVHEKGPRVPYVIGYTLGETFDADMVGDTYLFSRLHRLASKSLPKPLVALSGDTTTLRGCEAKLTDLGRAVLDGNANAVQVNGIDDWVLGTHLSSAAGSVWYRKEDALVRAR
jgi:hypothetical protein